VVSSTPRPYLTHRKDPVPIVQAGQEKEIFYGNLEEICSRIPRHDMIIIMGDLNAKLCNKE
jgi:hypothetical protein